MADHDDVVLTERDHKRLLESRNAFANTLAALLELEGKEGDQTAERKRILAIADRQLEMYGKHQAFVYSSYPVDPAARRRVKILLLICLYMALNGLAFWFFWPEQTNWLIRGAAIGLLAIAGFFVLVLALPALHERLNRL